MQREGMARAGRLWDNKDFETIKLDKFGIYVDVLSGAKKPKQILSRSQNMQRRASIVIFMWLGWYRNIWDCSG